MSKFYFKYEDSEIAYEKEYFEERMKSEGIDEIEVFEANPEIIGSGIFWCKKQLFCGSDTADTCGKQCEEYEPKNGKNGCCRHHSHWLYTHGKKVTLKI